MAAPLAPTIIQGPAVVIHNSQTYYTKSGIKTSFKRDTFKVETDDAGAIDERLKSDEVEISFQPCGEIEAMTKYFPWGVANIGESILNPSAAADKSVVIHTKAGQTITYPRGGVTKMPTLRLRPTDTLFGDMAITCIGKSSTQRTAADFWKTVASAAFTDTSFDETKIKTAIYEAAYGSSPYDHIAALEGFELELAMEVERIMSDDWGVADIILKSLSGTARFRPSNLTEAQIDTLLACQNTGAILPGQSLAKSNTDLVISSDAFTATLSKCGPKAMAEEYKTGAHRHGILEFVNKRTWTSGAANEIWTLTVA